MLSLSKYEALTIRIHLLILTYLAMDDSTLSSSQLYRLAIDAALNSNWQEAVKLNQQIIGLEPENVDALTRLGRAYMELGKIEQAKKFYNLALKSDPYNPIATKNLKILKSSKSGEVNNMVSQNNFVQNGELRKFTASLFLQEPGKTKIVTLSKVAEPQKLSKAYCGMQVELQIKNRKITVLDQHGSYLGILPDDVSHRLVRLIKGGNKYNTYIKSVKVNSLTVLIREAFRSKRFKNQPSFLDFHPASSTAEIITSYDSTSDSENSEYEEAEEQEV